MVAIGGAPARAVAQGASLAYGGTVLGTQGLEGYWRLGEASGTVAAEASGHTVAGSYFGAPGLGARGALSADADNAVRFDGGDDELQAGGALVAGAATLEGWFFWEAGVAVMRDATSSSGWIMAYDSGGRVAYRAGARRSRRRWRRRTCAMGGTTSC